MHHLDHFEYMGIYRDGGFLLSKLSGLSFLGLNFFFTNVQLIQKRGSQRKFLIISLKIYLKSHDFKKILEFSSSSSIEVFLFYFFVSDNLSDRSNIKESNSVAIFRHIILGRA